MWISVILSFLAISLANLKVCYSSGKLSVQLLKFKNDGHKLKDGSCCDDIWSRCTDACDNYFKICVTETSQSKCNLGNLKTKVLGNDALTFPGIGGDLGNGHKNPLVFSFTKWKGATLNIEVWDYESGSAWRGKDDFVGILILDIRNTPKPHTQTAPTEYKVVRSASSNNRYIELNIKVHCDTNYLVPECSRECVARDDDLGHYTCDYVNGLVKCNQNWYSDRCTKYCKARDDSQGHYTCDKFGEKNCTVNWFGVNCTKYCEKSDDATGHYVCDEKTGEKLCLASWFGGNCLNFCSSRDDNGGHYSCDLKTGSQVCLQNWFGVNCSVYCIPQDDVTLGHYWCDHNGNRVCLPGWEGTWCTLIRIKSSPKDYDLKTRHNTPLQTNIIYASTPPEAQKSSTQSNPSLYLSGYLDTPTFETTSQLKATLGIHVSPAHTQTSRTQWLTNTITKTSVIEREQYSRTFTSQNKETINSANQPLHTTTTKRSVDHSFHHLNDTKAKSSNSEINTAHTTNIKQVAITVKTTLSRITTTAEHSYLDTDKKKSTQTTTASPSRTNTFTSHSWKGVDTKNSSIYDYETSSTLTTVWQVYPQSNMRANSSNSARIWTKNFTAIYHTSISSHKTEANIGHSLVSTNKSMISNNKELASFMKSTSVVQKSKSASSGDDVRVSLLSTSFQHVTKTVFRISPSPSGAFDRSVYTSRVVEQTVWFILHLKTEFYHDNKTLFELSLKDKLKNSYKTKEHNNFQYDFDVSVTAVNKCYDKVVLNLDFTFGVLLTGLSDEKKEIFRQNIKLTMKQIFNTSEVFDKNDKHKTVINCELYKKKIHTKTKMYILSAVAVFFCSVIVVLAVLTVQKIRKRKKMFTKVHPEGSPDQTKTKKDDVVTIPKSVSTQELLYLEDL